MKVETDHFSPFTFQTGVEKASLEILLLRVEDAHKRFKTSPLSQAGYYLEHIHTYFTLFNTSRKQAEKKSDAPQYRLCRLLFRGHAH